MAKIWPVYEGRQPTRGEPWARIPLADAIELFELRPEEFFSELETTPRFGPSDRNLTFAGFKHIVVEVERNEGRKAIWKPGFYKSHIGPKDAFGRLIRHALAAELGPQSLVSVAWEPTTDSQGQDALKIAVVIAPGGVRKLQAGAGLDALVRVRHRLEQMGDDRIPLIEYATEAELQESGGP